MKGAHDTQWENRREYREPFQEGEIVVEEYTPSLSAGERKERRRDIEARLYAVFSRYSEGGMEG